MNGVPNLIVGSSVQPNGVEVYGFVSLEPQKEDLDRLARTPRSRPRSR